MGRLNAIAKYLRRERQEDWSCSKKYNERKENEKLK